MAKRFHRFITHLLAALAASFLFAGCAMKPNVDVSTASTTGFGLRDLYIYSFLDVREASLGSKYLTEFERIFGEELEKRHVRSRQLWFGRSETSRHTSMIDTGSSAYLVRRSSMMVPVKETVLENANDEAGFGARYRLVLFPKQIANQSAGLSYTVHLGIYEVTTGRLVWYATMQGQNFNWVVRDEVPEQRARLAVQSIVEAMERSNLFPAGIPVEQPAPTVTGSEESGSAGKNEYEVMKTRYADRLARQRAAQSQPQP